MSIFSDDIITSDPHVTLTEQFGLDLRQKVNSNRKLLRDAIRTHGPTSVMNCLEMYVISLLHCPKYEDLYVAGRSAWEKSDTYNYLYVTYIKDSFWVVLTTKPKWMDLNINLTLSRNEEIGRGLITLVLEKDLSEWKYEVKLK